MNLRTGPEHKLYQPSAFLTRCHQNFSVSIQTGSLEMPTLDDVGLHPKGGQLI